MLQSRIREIRKEKGLTLQDVADRAGTTAQTIGRLETGMRTLSIKWVQRIATALGTDPGELQVPMEPLPKKHLGPLHSGFRPNGPWQLKLKTT